MLLCNMHDHLFLSAYFLAGTFGIIGITIVGSAFMVCFLVHVNKIFLCGTIFHFYLCYKDQPMFSGFYNCHLLDGLCQFCTLSLILKPIVTMLICAMFTIYHDCHDKIHFVPR